MLPDVRVFESAAFIGDQRQLTRAMRTTLGDDYLVGIGIHDKIGVVRDDDDLSPMSGGAEPLHEFLED